MKQNASFSQYVRIFAAYAQYECKNASYSLVRCEDGIMGLRFRLGPFTFGRGGTRLSLWSRGLGFSTRLTGKKGRSFGKVGFGPFSWFFGGSSTTSAATRRSQTVVEKKMQNRPDSYEGAAIKAFGSDLPRTTSASILGQQTRHRICSQKQNPTRRCDSGQIWPQSHS